MPFSAGCVAVAAYAPPQSHCTTWLRRYIAAASAGANPHRRRSDARPIGQPASNRLTQISYAFRRQLGGMLDTRSARGRMLSPHRSARGVWALGEALGDAVVTRVPQAFDAQERADQRLA